MTPTEEEGSDEIDAQYRVTEPNVNVQSSVTEPSITRSEIIQKEFVNHL